jgi:hypothetical protein
MPFDGPFMLGPFSIDGEGRLALRRADLPPAFTVQWRGYPVHVRLGRSFATGTRPISLAFEAMLGRVPSSAEAAQTMRRDRTFATLRAIPPLLPAEWRLHLLADHRITLTACGTTDLPARVTELLGDVTRFLIALGPYLDLLEEVGVAVPAGVPAGATVGRANTWPG